MLRFTNVTGCTLLSVSFDAAVSVVAADVDSFSHDFHPCSIRTKPFLMDILETFSIFVVERLILLVSPSFSNWKRRLALTGLIESLSASKVRHLHISSSFSDACFMIFRRTRSFSSSRSVDISSSFIELCFNDNLSNTYFLENDGCFCAVSSSRFSLPSDSLDCFVPSDAALIHTASKLSSRNGRAKLSQIRTLLHINKNVSCKMRSNKEKFWKRIWNFAIACNRRGTDRGLSTSSVTQHQTRHRSKRFDMAPLFIHTSCLYVND
ncbi:hypothetical protein PUN28_001588 [Cardiocondyla obscurior]|uniref:Uncharacterized protein n=1 Tax=Cardiocondyla obscurior TaxID=286306 RepID=A0AAW2H641_9HYME